LTGTEQRHKSSDVSRGQGTVHSNGCCTRRSSGSV
jgi:hypothetical protein